MKKTFLFLLCLLSIFTASCSAQSDEAAVSTTLWEGAETTVYIDGRSAYVVDYEAYGEKGGSDFFLWRNQGNPDFFEDAVVYENGTDLTLESLASVYSLSNSDEKWGVSISHVAEELDVREWSHLLNLEKYENGKWVRQGIIGYTRLSSSTEHAIMSAYYDGGMAPEVGWGLFPELWKEGLTRLSPLTIRVSEIFPEPTPGQYRFIFYISVFKDGETEYRQYYIPFEVVE